MKISIALLAGALLAASTLAHAHTHLKESQPADGSVLNVAPVSIALTFSQPARITALTLQKDGEGEQKLAPLPTIAAVQVSVPTGKLAPGKYVVTYRVLSADNHIISGKLHFTVDPNAASSTGKQTDPAHTKH
jgi:methionine-rich copper-binding protein CopC